MSIKLLPAAVNPVDPSQATDVSASLVPLNQGAIATRAGQISLVPSADAFAWSSSTRRGEAQFIYGTLVEDSQTDETGSGGQYVSALAWGHSVESTAIAHYLSIAASLASWSGRLIDLYA
ncbi:MAG: hypothetical protein WAM04_00550 [Candidatus Sulfotelmatobacter sp.]